MAGKTLKISDPGGASSVAEDRPATVSLYQQADQAGLSCQSRFRFHCQAGLDCFNRCCRTPTIILSPYDILRLKQCLGITSGEFLQRYTRQQIEAMSNLALILMDTAVSPEGGCPFLGADGCAVYAHRPAACRLFPITMGSQLTEQGILDHYFCRRLDYCRGFDTDVEWTLASWQANQEFAEYDAGRREWLEIILAKGRRGRIAMEAQFQDLFAVMVYDLDRFRSLAAEPAFLRVLGLDGQALEEVKDSDLALLKFNYRYLKKILLAS
jgi:Fe-S-cluster containining protein